MRAVPDGAARFLYLIGILLSPCGLRSGMRGFAGSWRAWPWREDARSVETLFAQRSFLIKPCRFKSEAGVVASRAYGANDIDGSVSSFDCNLACAFDERLSEASMLRILPLAVKLSDFSVYMHFANHGLSDFDREGAFGFLQLFDLVLAGEREA